MGFVLLSKVPIVCRVSSKPHLATDRFKVILALGRGEGPAFNTCTVVGWTKGIELIVSSFSSSLSDKKSFENFGRLLVPYWNGEISWSTNRRIHAAPDKVVVWAVLLTALLWKKYISPPETRNPHAPHNYHHQFRLIKQVDKRSMCTL